MEPPEAPSNGFSLIRSGSGKAPSRVSVSDFRGRDATAWRSGLPAFATVSLGELWPGIEV